MVRGLMIMSASAAARFSGLLNKPSQRHREAAKRPWRSRKTVQIDASLDCFVGPWPSRNDGRRLFSSRLDRQQHLPDMRALLQIVMGFGGVGQREGTIDHWPEATIFDQRPHRFPDRGNQPALFRDRPRPEPRAGKARVFFGEGLVVELDLAALFGGNHDELAAAREQPDIARDIIAAD